MGSVSYAVAMKNADRLTKGAEIRRKNFGPLNFPLKGASCEIYSNLV